MARVSFLHRAVQLWNAATITAQLSRRPYYIKQSTASDNLVSSCVRRADSRAIRDGNLVRAHARIDLVLPRRDKPNRRQDCP